MSLLCDKLLPTKNIKGGILLWQNLKKHQVTLKQIM